MSAPQNSYCRNYVDASYHVDKSYPLRNHSTQTHIDMSNISSCLQDGSFWEYYNTTFTKGDGHCLIYSIICSMKYQRDINLCYSDLCSRIRTETCDYIDYYKDLIHINSDLEIQRLLCAYVDGKNFDTKLGDLIPLI